MNKLFLTGALILASLMGACAPSAAPAAEAPAAADPYAAGDAAQTDSMAASVVANDQTIVDGSVTVASAYMNAAGWIVIHAEADGKPGPVLGYAPLPAGESRDVKVEIDAASASARLFVMLHQDAGVTGTYEFPGADAPVKNGDMVVMVPFSVK